MIDILYKMYKYKENYNFFEIICLKKNIDINILRKIYDLYIKDVDIWFLTLIIREGVDESEIMQYYDLYKDNFDKDFIRFIISFDRNFKRQNDYIYKYRDKFFSLYKEDKKINIDFFYLIFRLLKLGYDYKKVDMICELYKKGVDERIFDFFYIYNKILKDSDKFYAFCNFLENFKDVKTISFILENNLLEDIDKYSSFLKEGRNETNNFILSLIKNKKYKEFENLVKYLKEVNISDKDVILLSYFLDRYVTIKNVEDIYKIISKEYNIDLNKIDMDILLEIIKNNDDFFKKYKKNGVYVGNLDLRKVKINNLMILKDLNISKVEGSIICYFNRNLKSLKGCPKNITSDLDCSNCGLEELGMENVVEVFRNFDCSFNRNLKSLKGNPKFVNFFICNNCGLNEIDLDKGTEIEKELVCLEGNNVTKEQVKRYIKKNNIVLKGEIR